MQSELPTGTVTFLFTDIEGSTRLLQELGDGYAEILSEHRRELREAWRLHAGVEVDMQGDAFFVAFERDEPTGVVCSLRVAGVEGRASRGRRVGPEPTDGGAK
jgi:class 3 adenylate cyclase